MNFSRRFRHPRFRNLVMSQTFGALTLFLFGTAVLAGDWSQFRGPHGDGRSEDRGVPEKWSEKENVLWKTKLPGLGSSSPITVGDAIFLTCYSGYAGSGK